MALVVATFLAKTLRMWIHFEQMTRSGEISNGTSSMAMGKTSLTQGRKRFIRRTRKELDAEIEMMKRSGLPLRLADTKSLPLRLRDATQTKKRAAAAAADGRTLPGEALVANLETLVACGNRERPVEVLVVGIERGTGTGIVRDQNVGRSESLQLLPLSPEAVAARLVAKFHQKGEEVSEIHHLEGEVVDTVTLRKRRLVGLCLMAQSMVSMRQPLMPLAETATRLLRLHPPMMALEILRTLVMQRLLVNNKEQVQTVLATTSPALPNNGHHHDLPSPPLYQVIAATDKMTTGGILNMNVNNVVVLWT